ncbi:MAG TPA: Ig-like domain-containing protein [Sphingomicrobium sp.]|nr:Ig-like domain-containing protein [Sphingomicrobium sp.]
MATNTGGGTTASFSNTPQAKDDSYIFTEQQLFAAPSIYNLSTRTISLNVMSNDLGGNAKSLYSIDDGGTGAMTDLLQSNVTTSWEQTADGNWIRINAGLIEYRIDDGSHTAGSARDVDTLNQGETINDSFVYAIRMANGTLSEARVTISITGTNDGPVAHADTATTGENQCVLVDVLANDTDVDIGHVFTLTSVDALPPGQGSVSIQNNQLKFDPGTDFDHLAQGATATVIVHYTMSDEWGATSTSTATITVTGVNDAPVASDDTGAGNEDALITGTLAGDVTDVDDGATQSFSVVGAPPAGFTLNPNGSWSLDATNTAYQHLAQGATTDVIVTYQVSDGLGGTDTATLTITVTGVNDTPQVAAALTSSADEGTSSYGLDLLDGASDPDDGETATLTVTNVSYQVDGGSSSPTAPSGVSLAGSTLTVDPSDPSFNHLAVGDHTTITVTYDVTDAQGAVIQQTETVTINGTNDGPVVGGTNIVTTNEDSASTAVTIGASDPDDGDSLAYSVKTGDEPAHGDVSFDQAAGTFVYTPDGNFNGDDSFTILVSDGNGGTAEQVVSVTVNSVNDDPTLAPVAAGSVSEIDQLPTVSASGVSGTLVGADVDGDTLTYGIQGGSASGVNLVSLLGTYGTLTVNTATGAYSYAPNAAAIDPLDTGENPTDSFTVTVSDGHGGTGTQTYTVNVHGGDDTPTLNAVTSGSITEVANSTTENSSGLSGTLVGHDVDVETLTYGIQGGTVHPDGTVTLAGTYGTLTVDIATGSYHYDPNTTAIEALNAGQNPQDQFTVTVSDGDAPLGTQIYTVNLTGADEAPADIAPDAHDDNWVLSDTAIPSGTIRADWLLTNDTDIDGPQLFVSSVTGLPSWLTANFVGGHLTSFNVVGTAVAGNYTFSYTLSDGTLTDTAQVTLTVLNTTDAGSGDTFTLDGNDFSWVDLQSGPDTINGDLILNGNAGTDIFIGNNGNDKLNGGAGNDQLFGNENTDTLNGGTGDDFLDGGNGNDTLTGGAGNDVFVLSSVNASNIDTITDYSHSAGNLDLINITQVLSVAASTNVIAGGFLRVTTTGLVQIDTSGGGDNWQSVGNVNVAAGLTYNIQYLSGGIATTVTVTPSAPPIGIDLNHDGLVSFIGTDAGTTFDYGYGKVATAWVGPQDGILVRDANGDGKAQANEIVFSTGGSDLQGLAQYDSNDDGQISSADAAFSQFAVWQDANSNGVVDAGEMKGLTALGITSISLSSDGIGYSAAGGDVSVVGTGSVTYADGSTGVLADAVFATGAKVADEQLRATATMTSSTPLLGAIAAAGLMAIPAHAEAQLTSLQAEGWTSHSVPLATQALTAESAQANHALSGEQRIAIPEVASQSAVHTEVAHTLPATDQPFASVHEPVQQVTELLQGTAETARAEVFAHADAAPAVSAEMLQAAMAGVAQQAADKSAAQGDSAAAVTADVGHVLADALAGGSDGKPDIESLLHAIVGGGHGAADVGHALAAVGPMVNEAFSPSHVMMPLAEEMAAHIAAITPPA